jgi:hypothetical protein
MPGRRDQGHRWLPYRSGLCIIKKKQEVLGTFDLRLPLSADERAAGSLVRRSTQLRCPAGVHTLNRRCGAGQARTEEIGHEEEGVICYDQDESRVNKEKHDAGC